ncbi:MAG: hypothetical protein KatS3mg096_593 [Candidatus Parcubacteria bacterium]|nr:MAG: hypothetical protein KatS3mg096_593 [Candidatus Parcubacteria bacterium]
MNRNLKTGFAYDMGDGHDYLLDSGCLPAGTLPYAMTSIPYSIIVTNTDPANQGRFVLFNFNRFQITDPSEQNLQGVPTSGGVIRITTGDPDLTYAEIYTQTANQPTVFAGVRIVSQTQTNLQQILKVVTKDASGKALTSSIPVSAFIDGRYQNQSIVDVPLQIKVDAKTSIVGIIAPNSSITFNFFVGNQVVPSNQLFGASPVVRPLEPSAVPATPMIGGRPIAEVGGMVKSAATIQAPAPSIDQPMESQPVEKRSILGGLFSR